MITSCCSGYGRCEATHIRLAIFVDQLLVLQQQFDGLDEFGIDGLQQSVFGLDAHDDQQLDHFEVFAVDGDGQRTAAERIDAVDVDVLVPMSALQNSVGEGSRIDNPL